MKKLLLSVIISLICTQIMAQQTNGEHDSKWIVWLQGGVCLEGNPINDPDGDSPGVTAGATFMREYTHKDLSPNRNCFGIAPGVSYMHWSPYHAGKGLLTLSCPAFIGWEGLLCSPSAGLYLGPYIQMAVYQRNAGISQLQAADNIELRRFNCGITAGIQLLKFIRVDCYLGMRKELYNPITDEGRWLFKYTATANFPLIFFKSLPR